jgi:hypothetical protein
MSERASTAWFIDYDIRPSKQIERKVLFETVRAGELAGIDVSALPYVGLGGVRYTDFLAARRILGTRDFISLERDKKLAPRCQYNRPFESVTVFNVKAEEFLQSGGLSVPAVVWLDFEYPVNRNCRADIFSLVAKCKPGSFIFLTALAEINRQVAETDDRKKKEFYVRQLGSFAQSFEAEEFSNRVFPGVAVRMMQAFFIHGFKGRTEEGVYIPYFNMIYKDSVWMATAGGYFGSSDTALNLLAALEQKFDFIKPSGADSHFEVPQFNITEAERRLFDQAALPDSAKPIAGKQLARLGFSEEQVSQYRVVMRHVPRYFEALL